MKHQSTTVKKHKTTSVLAQVAETYSDLKPGVTLMVGPINAGAALLCQATMVKAVVRGSPFLSVPTPVRDNIFIVDSGPMRQLEQLSAIRVKLGFGASVFKRCEVLKRETSSALNWTDAAAVSILLKMKMLKSGGYIFLMLPAGTEPDFRGLQQLNRMAEEHDTRIIMFCPGAVDCEKYSAVFHEIFTITPREPNPGFMDGFEISCPQLAYPSSLAHGKLLCCLRLGDDGLESEITPYIADDLKTRLMAILKRVGWSYEKIGKLVVLDKSNVHRNLRNVTADVPEGWNTAKLNDWLEACDLDPIEDDDVGVEDSDSDDQTAESGEYDDGDDLDDLDDVKPVAQNSRNERNTRNDTKPQKPRR